MSEDLRAAACWCDRQTETNRMQAPSLAVGLILVIVRVIKQFVEPCRYRMGNSQRKEREEPGGERVSAIGPEGRAGDASIEL